MPVEKAPELYSPIDGLKIMLEMRPYLKLWRKWGKVTIQDVTPRFKNPFLRQAFPYIFNLQNPPDFPMMGVLMTLAWMDQKTAGYPVGGSLELARAIEHRYLALGGEIHFKSRVVKILVEADPSGRGDRAVGVRLDDDVASLKEHRSDVVISAADGHTTIFDMLDGKYINFDPSLAPAGKTFARVMFASDYEYWKKLAQDPERYKAEKEQIADQVVASLDRRFPGLAARVEMRDVATPMTWERYTGNWRGSFQGWLETTKTLRMRMNKTLPGLGNFYMAGQWVEPDFACQGIF